MSGKSDPFQSEPSMDHYGPEVDDCEQLPPEKAEFLRIRKEAGKLIDPERAQCFIIEDDITDPYGVRGYSPDESVCGRLYYAKNPGSEIWVEFHDIQRGIRDKLFRRLEEEGF